MASFATPGTSRRAAAALLFAALVFAPAVSAQSPFEPVARDDRQAEIVGRIRDEQALNGAYSPALVEPLMSLSFLYRESGDRVLAIAAIERALQVQRANYGLRTLDQAPLIEQWIESAEDMEDFATAWELEQTLVSLARKNPDDLRAVPIFREIGDKRIELLEQYAKGGTFLPQIALGCYYRVTLTQGSAFEPQRGCHAGSRRVAIQAILREAQEFYGDAIRVLQRNELYSSDALREIEHELVRTSYLHGHDGTVGKESLRRVFAYDVASDAPVATRAESLVEIADWDLLFAEGRTETEAVLAAYEAAYRELAESGASPESLEAMFAPDMPVVLPAFLPNPLASERTQSNDYIDVAFEIDRYGESGRIEITGATANVPSSAKRLLVRAIGRSTFRPRLVAGRVADDAPVAIRYYLDD